jgi:hypothetical protein
LADPARVDLAAPHEHAWTAADDDGGVPRWTALALTLPFLVSALGVIGLGLALLANSGHWVWFGIGAGAETYGVLVVVVLVRNRP